MNRQVVYLALMVVVPLTLLAWLGLRFAQQQDRSSRQRFREVQEERLRDVDAAIAKVLAKRERELFELLASLPTTTEGLRAAMRTNPHVRQLFMLDTDGRLVYPSPTSTITANERQFLTAFGEVLLSGELYQHVETPGVSSQLPSVTPFQQSVVPLLPQTNAEEQINVRGRQPRRVESPFVAPNNDAPEDLTWQAGPQQAVQLPAGGANAGNPITARQGWYTWYWGRGLNLILWQRQPNGELVGVLLERARWMADIIAELPDTEPWSPERSSTDSRSARTQLVDSDGSVVYQWGRLESPEGATAFAELPLSTPLSSWRLKYFLTDDTLAGSSRVLYFSVWTSLAVVAVGLLILATFIYREQQRYLREAAQRVNFVNQVSHELKTPLTNVRMYAELLESDLENLDDESTAAAAQSRLSVIVTESQRLSRLIGNVLTFARDQRRQIQLHARQGHVDDVLTHVIEQFRPSLAKRGVNIVFTENAGTAVQVDTDALEQIVVNLLSNVEKYAADGKCVSIASSQAADFTTIVVADDGPGLPTSQEDKIFQPFYRGSDRIEGTTGTGIGLSIARQLARLHGGDLRLLPSESGACFEVRLHTPRQGDVGHVSVPDGVKE